MGGSVSTLYKNNTTPDHQKRETPDDHNSETRRLIKIILADDSPMQLKFLNQIVLNILHSQKIGLVKEIEKTNDTNSTSSKKLVADDKQLEIILVKDGKELVDSHRHKPADIIITDLEMPNKSGIEAILDIIKSENNKVKIMLNSTLSLDQIQLRQDWKDLQKKSELQEIGFVQKKSNGFEKTLEDFLGNCVRNIKEIPSNSTKSPTAEYEIRSDSQDTCR